MNKHKSAPTVLALLLLSALESHALLTVTNRYDFGSTTTLTQEGWNAVTFAQKYGPGTSGFDLVNASFGVYDRHPTTWHASASSFITLTNLQRDGIMGRFPGNSLIWHDLVPSGSSNATFTLYLGDPLDAVFQPTTARVAYAGVTNVIGVFFAGSSQRATSFVGSVSVREDSTLDLMLTVGGVSETSLARWSGLEIVYSIPEPSMGMLGLLSAILFGWVRKPRK